MAASCQQSKMFAFFINKLLTEETAQLDSLHVDHHKAEDTMNNLIYL
jgi:hypothetical protein